MSTTTRRRSSALKGQMRTRGSEGLDWGIGLIRMLCVTRRSILLLRYSALLQSRGWTWEGLETQAPQIGGFDHGAGTVALLADSLPHNGADAVAHWML